MDIPMAKSIDDYFPPIPGYLDDRKIEAYADEQGLVYAWWSEERGLGWRVFLKLGGTTFPWRDAPDCQKALDLAIDRAIELHQSFSYQRHV
jgi:hypothetical protein